MGYHDYHEIPNYWNYAHLYVLQDHLFEPVASYSLPAHLYMLAAQSGGYVGPNSQPMPTSYNFPEITELLASGKIDLELLRHFRKHPRHRGRPHRGDDPPAAARPAQYTLWNPLPAFPGRGKQSVPERPSGVHGPVLHGRPGGDTSAGQLGDPLGSGKRASSRRCASRAWPT